MQLNFRNRYGFVLPYQARQLIQMIEKYGIGTMKYLIELFWSDEDEGWIAVVPDLPGCSAVGATPESAAAEVEDAIEAWIMACRAAGDPVPEPSSKARRAA